MTTGVSGWLMTSEGFSSAEWLEELREGLASLTLALVGVHILGVLAMSAFHSESFVRAMITSGRRRHP